MISNSKKLQFKYAVQQTCYIMHPQHTYKILSSKLSSEKPCILHTARVFYAHKIGNRKLLISVQLKKKVAYLKTDTDKLEFYLIKKYVITK